ncbi:MAG TPA: type II toxin-antitoxin system VapC family toxin [Thermoanaerobaculia bacterium]|jgi:predicted nucleic acid-binding protein|nr:type II toxin-antitoxin system VapC family toxin [Thermoanaerobaculia bacterium]
MNVLCDTNILSELTKPQPNEGVVAWAGTLSRMALSVVTVEEVTFGFVWKSKPRIKTWFEDFVNAHCEILPVTVEIARRAGELRGVLKARGQTRTQADMLIAATAQIHALTLVTRNSTDFESCGIPILNPFT